MGTRRRLTLVLCLLAALFALTGTLVHFVRADNVSVPSLATGPAKGVTQGDDRRDRPEDKGKLPATGKGKGIGIASGLVAGLVINQPSKSKPHYSGSGSTGGSGGNGGSGNDDGGDGGTGGDTGGEGVLTVTLGSIGLLYPGEMREFEVTIFNPFDFAITPDTVIVSSLGTNACPEENLGLGTYPVSGMQIDANSSGTAITQIGLTSSAPTECQGERFRIQVRVEAGRP